MGMAVRVREHLQSRGVDYQLVPLTHPLSKVAPHIYSDACPEKTAKSVILEDNQGYRLMAVMPATNRLLIKELNQQLGRGFRLIPEAQFKDTFDDCQKGSVPALGEPYQVQAVYDDQLMQNSEVYFEAGDNKNLVKVSRSSFEMLIAYHRHGIFSVNRDVELNELRTLD